jgi:hypothetical protein
MITPAYVRVLRRVNFKGGGSSSGDTYDAAYNARMATIAESQQEMAEEYFNYWQDTYRPMETEQIAANRRLTPYETDLQIDTLQSQRNLVPIEAEARAKALSVQNAQGNAALQLLPHEVEARMAALGEQNYRMADSITHMKERAPVRTEFYHQAKEGVDAESWASRAAADASQAFMGSQGTMNRNAARMGVNPASGRFAGMQTSLAMDRSKAIGGAKTVARERADQESFSRLNTAMGYGG